MARAAYIAEPPGEHITGARESDLANEFEAWCFVRGLLPESKGAQERFLVDGLGLTYPEAKNLIRAYELDQRDREAVALARETFGAWCRRGDLIQVRGKAKHGWRTTS